MASNDITAAYEANQKQRLAPEVAERRARMLQWAEEEENPKGAPQAAPQAPTAPAAPKASGAGVGTEIWRAGVGGVRDAAQGALDLIDEAATWMDNNVINLRMESEDFGKVGGSNEQTGGFVDLPEVAKNETTAGQVTRGIVQFAVPFMGAVKALKVGKAATTAGKLALGTAAGAATDFVAFDPHEKRLSNLIMDMSDNDPMFGKSVFEYLQADPNDSAFEGRFKNMLEGMGIGLAAEGLFLGLRGARAHFAAKGEDPAESVLKAASEVDEAAKPLEFTSEGSSPVKPGPNKPELSLADKDADAIPFTEAPSRVDELLKDSKLALEDDGIKSLKDNTVAQNDALAARKGRVWVDPETGAFALKEAGVGKEIDLDVKVDAALERPGFERSAEDLIALRAMEDLQAQAFKGIDEVTEAGSGKAAFSDADRATARTPIILKENGEAAFTEAERAAFRKEGEELATRIREGQKKMATDAMAAMERIKRAAASAAPTNIEEATKRLQRIAQGQGGYMAPQLFAQVASGGGGAAAGLAMAPEGASAEEKRGYALAGLLMGLGAKKAGTKVLDAAAAAKKAARPKTVEEVAKRADDVFRAATVKYEGSRPKADVKKAPPIRQEKVQALARAIQEGKVSELADAVDEADFNFAHLDSDKDIEDMMNATSAVFSKEIDNAKHGTQTFGMIKDISDMVGAGEGSLKELYQGTDNLAARVHSHRAMLMASTRQTVKLAKAVQSVRADEQVPAMLELRKQLAVHAAIQAKVKGVQTEIGRALAQFRIQVGADDFALNEANNLLEAWGGHRANLDFARKLASVDDPKKLAAIARKGALSRSEDALFEVWINGLLSAPATHVVNTVSNTLVALGSVAEKMTASAIGTVLRRGDDAIDSTEVKAQMFGMVEGIVDALRISGHGMDALKQSAKFLAHGELGAARNTIRDNLDEFGNAWQAFATDAPITDTISSVSREMGGQRNAFSAANMGIDNKALGKGIDLLGAAIRTPGRMLTTSDELFKTMHYRGELKAQAYRTARQEGLEGDALMQRIASLIEDPTPTMRADAMTAARQGTFTMPLGEFGRKVQGLASVPGVRYIVPFVRTPTNIMKYVGVRTPILNLAAKSVRAEFAAGGRRADMMYAKTAMGTMLYTLGWWMHAQGMITGGGEKQRSAERLGGQQPYSLKVGDQYISLHRLDPLFSFMGIAADISDISGHADEKTMEELAAASVLAVNRNLVSKTYLQGVVQLVNAVADPERYGQNFLEHFAGSMVPFSALSGAITREVDGEVKEVRSVLDAIKARVPGFSDEVMPHVNLFGEDVRYTGGLGPDIASPFTTMNENPEPAAKEIARLNLDLRHPPREIGGGQGRPGIQLDEKQYYRWMKLMGPGFKEAANKLVQSDQYNKLREDPSNSLYENSKERVIRSLFEKHKRAAMYRLLKEDAALMEKYRQNLRNQSNALRGIQTLPIE